MNTDSFPQIKQRIEGKSESLVFKRSTQLPTRQYVALRSVIGWNYREIDGSATRGQESGWILQLLESYLNCLSRWFCASMIKSLYFFISAYYYNLDYNQKYIIYRYMYIYVHIYVFLKIKTEKNRYLTKICKLLNFFLLQN